MQWSEQTIEHHEEAARRINQVKDDVFTYIRENRKVTEHEVQQYIVGLYKKYGLVSSYHPPIVAFGPGAAQPHYFPPEKGSKQLEPETLVLIDVWARLSGVHMPFADITWVGYYGKNPSAKIQTVFDTVIRSRDAGITYLQSQLKAGRLPTGKEVDDACTTIIQTAGFGQFIKHRTGHSIGFTSPHGIYRNVNQKNTHPLVPNLGYTIEPGIYIDGEFGVRSEIDFYINEKNELITTTQPQQELIMI